MAARMRHASRRMVVHQWPTTASGVCSRPSRICIALVGVVSGVPLCALRSRTRSRPSCIVRCCVCRPAAPTGSPCYPASRRSPSPPTFCRPVQHSLRSLLSGWPAHDVSAQRLHSASGPLSGLWLIRSLSAVAAVVDRSHGPRVVGLRCIVDAEVFA
ncbi:hypothetical protein B0H14DRAFT_3676366 [Mycena olivaceomarginata]|nr:hypothetical protein B0H14DRAFT_3676366 [Mycena olivaceomarginata]